MRMTVSIAVMMLESTGDYQYGLPIMAALIAARWTGNLFNKGAL
jgi:chloride channel 7